MTDEVPEAVREGRELLNSFYGFEREDDPDRWLQADEFRQDVYRMIVIQVHLAIEELVRSFLFEKLTADPDRGIFTHKQNLEYVYRLTTRQVLDLAGRLHVLSKEGYQALVTLNGIRNKCSHHWMLHSFSVAEKLKNQTREVEPRIDYEGENLLTPEVMKDEFLPLYGELYIELFGVHYGVFKESPLYTDPTLEAVKPL